MNEKDYNVFLSWYAVGFAEDKNLLESLDKESINRIYEDTQKCFKELGIKQVKCFKVSEDNFLTEYSTSFCNERTGDVYTEDVTIPVEDIFFASMFVPIEIDGEVSHERYYLKSLSSIMVLKSQDKN